MTDIVKITPNALAPLGTSSGHLVAVLAYDGVSAFELGIAVEIFRLPGMAVDWYRVLACAEQPGKLLVANGGVGIVASVGLEALTDAVTIIVPGWRGIEASPPKALTDALSQAYARGTRIASICSGVFVLAAAGLLQRRRAAVHLDHVVNQAEQTSPGRR